MKKIAFVLIAIALISASALAGDMAKSGQWGVQTALGISKDLSELTAENLGVKFMASDNVAIRLMAGFSSYSPGGGGNSSSAYNFGGGFEYHMDSKGGNVSPYVGLQAGYSGVSIGGATSNPSAFGVQGVLGGEYFFSSNFSWGGEIGVGFASMSSGVSGASSSSLFGTTSATMIATWYLN